MKIISKSLMSELMLVMVSATTLGAIITDAVPLLVFASGIQFGMWLGFKIWESLHDKNF